MSTATEEKKYEVLDTNPKLDGVKYREVIGKVLAFLQLWMKWYHLLGDSQKGRRKSNMMDKYNRICALLKFSHVFRPPFTPWLWKSIREDVVSCMHNMSLIRDEIDTLDLDELKSVQRLYISFPLDFIINKIMEPQSDILNDLQTWLNDPWDEEGPLNPPEYKVIHEETTQYKFNEGTVHTIRKYKQGDVNDEAEYQEWVNNERVRTLTKDEVREQYPFITLDAKLIEMDTLLSVLGKIWR